MKDEIASVPPAVLERFGLRPSEADVAALGSGHIHATVLVRGGPEPFVLQRLNEAVFPDLAMLVRNAERATAALQEAQARGDYGLEWAATIPDREGQTLVIEAGETWRATRYVGGTYTVDQVDDSVRAGRGAAAFGQFCAALIPADPSEFEAPIPGFHDFDRRLAQLEQAVDADVSGRAASAAREVEFCRAQEDLGAALRHAQEALPQRICHNDTKINNLLFDANDHGVRAVIDLDTCMPGWWMHDFGDIVRTFCSPENEDSRRLDRVRVREEIFAAVGSGFTEPLKPHLSADEREALWLGARGVALVIGMRFLTDYLAGDRYFAVSRPAQNLDRARNQFALQRDLSDRENELRPGLNP